MKETRDFADVIAAIQRLHDDQFEEQDYADVIDIDDDGKVYLVIHNLKARERVTAYFGPDGRFAHGYVG